MASKQPPTASELAYLAELKTRLRELRERQAAFMEHTADMLIRMSSTAVGEAFLGPPRQGTSSTNSGHVNIKRLIQRFEDLRKIATSQQLSSVHEVPEVPEELMNVDVRRLLKRYEKFIEEANVLQQSWFRLKQSTASSADLTECEKLSMVSKQSSKESSDSTSKGINDSASKVFNDSAFKGVQRFGLKGVQRFGLKGVQRFGLKVPASNDSQFDAEQLLEVVNTQRNCSKQKYGRARWGALLQMMLRLSPFNTCGKRGKCKKLSASSSSSIMLLKTNP
ncbi:LOW QUALITY PROTEIN: uncharacterized protein LOC111064711 [Drosophila obscura]|uniref:LOW QUALITY PROTEIN: uncharacterized protein LOC111064711 n=1 Tax=Drosophila obscura TaxID=7282 RepID=UPI001BB275EC|nr:LOW QUALITY PROTEIN: uncharacterized protein LOC111064711 [Drosophila obscura]